MPSQKTSHKLVYQSSGQHFSCQMSCPSMTSPLPFIELFTPCRCCTRFLTCISSLDTQHSRPECKCCWLCRSWGLCHNYSPLPLLCKSSCRQYITNGQGCVLIKLYQNSLWTRFASQTIVCWLLSNTTLLGIYSHLHPTDEETEGHGD